jgi:hypothetical protein
MGEHCRCRWESIVRPWVWGVGGRGRGERAEEVQREEVEVDSNTAICRGLIVTGRAWLGGSDYAVASPHGGIGEVDPQQNKSTRG